MNLSRPSPQFDLDVGVTRSYVRHMKRFLLLVPVFILWTSPAIAQDAATQERLDKLAGQIEDLIAAQKSQQKQINEILRDLDRFREQISRPSDQYATSDDLKRLGEAIKEVDRKRMSDAEIIRKEVLNLSAALKEPPVKRSQPPAKSNLPEKYFEHTVARGDTLSSIIQAYREQNVKVTLEEILKANPGLKPERMQVDQKIIIPAP